MPTQVSPTILTDVFSDRQRPHIHEQKNSKVSSKIASNGCKRLVPSRLHELHESKLLSVSRIEVTFLYFSWK